MTDLLDRIIGTPERPHINLHRLMGAYQLYITGDFTRLQLANEFDITGNVDEARQANQIADNLDTHVAGVAYCFNAANVTWTNQPAAITEIFGNVHRRQVLNFIFNDAIRLAARVSATGAASAVLIAQYSTDETNWFALTNNLSLNGVGTRVSTWAAIPAEAKVGDVFVRIVGQSGDAAADPVIGSVVLHASVPWDKSDYLSRVNGVLIALEDSDERLFRDVNGVVNKASVYTALQIAG